MTKGNGKSEWQKKVAAALVNAAGIGREDVKCALADQRGRLEQVLAGEVAVRQSFFYTFGQTPEKWAKLVADALWAAGITDFVVTGWEDWAAWPKTSYFVARIIPAGPEFRHNASCGVVDGRAGQN